MGRPRISVLYGALWLTVNVWPAMTIVPARAAPVFTVTLNDTLPLPLPAPDPLATTIQSKPDTAVHEQLLPVAVSATEPGPPAEANAWLTGAME